MQKTVTVPEQTIMSPEEVVLCDICKRVIYPEDLPEHASEDLYAQRLEIYANPESCVNSRAKFDLCGPCFEPIWTKICLAIGANPDDELRIGDDD